MTDHLFINDVEIELYPGTLIPLTFQINDLSELKDRQANFSHQFKVPKTKNNMRALEWANQVQGVSDFPYTKNPARVIKNGVQVVPDGMAIVESTDKSFNITVYSGLIDFYELIGSRKLSELGVSIYDHIWDLANILNSNGNTTDYKYPIVQYGDLTNASRDVDVRNQRPALFLHNLINLIFSEAGFTKAGPFWSDANYLKLLLPLDGNIYFVNADLTMLGAWSILVDAQHNPLLDPCSVLTIRANETWDLTLELNISVANWVDGVSILSVDLMNNVNFTPSTSSYDHPDTGGGGGNGNFTVNLTISGVASADVPQFIEVFLYQCDCDVADSEFYGDRTDGVDQGFYVHIIPEFLTDPGGGFGTTGAPAYDTVFTYGISVWNFHRLMPNMTQKDLLKVPANQFALFFSRDVMTDTIYAARMNDIVDNIPFALDWSEKLHDDKDSWKLDYRLPKYARKNYLKYAVDSSDLDMAVGTGDGFFECDDETLPPETTLIQLPFAASATKSYLNGLYAPIIRKMEGSEFRINTVQRIIVDDTQDITTGDAIHYLDGVTTSDETIDIPLAYFIHPAKTFNLGFEDSLIEDYYDGLVDILSRVKKVTALFKLDVNDIVKIDQIDPNTNLPYWFTPIYLWQFSSYFYVNKIHAFTGKGLTKVELIRIQAGDVCIPEFGPNILDNNDFAAGDTVWAKNVNAANWNITTGGAQHIPPGSASPLDSIENTAFTPQSAPVEKWRVSVTVTGMTTGSFTALCNNAGVTRTANGAYTEIIDDTGTGDLAGFFVLVSVDFDGTITYTSCEPQLTCGDNESN